MNAALTLRLLDSSGSELVIANRQLRPKQHKAEFIRELFQGFVIPAGFQGTVEVEIAANVPLAAVTLRTLNGLQTSSLPVVAVPEGQ